MRITVNETTVEVEPGTSLFTLRDRCKPEADVMVLNGAPAQDDCPLAAADRVVFIRKGEVPPAQELEHLMMARHTPGVHEKVKRASVGIAGLGGIGSAVAIALARIGVGRLVLADFDVVEPSNLNRQHYFIDQLGRYKTDALAENLERINPYVGTETHRVRLTAANVPSVFRRADVLVEGLDQVDDKAMLLESFTEAFPERPVVLASGLAGCGPGSTMGIHRIGSRVYVVGDLESGARPGRGLMAPRVGIAAHLQANLAVRLILGEEGA